LTGYFFGKLQRFKGVGRLEVICAVYHCFQRAVVFAWLSVESNLKGSAA
jgi:hypothetical protein